MNDSDIKDIDILNNLRVAYSKNIQNYFGKFWNNKCEISGKETLLDSKRKHSNMKVRCVKVVNSTETENCKILNKAYHI